MKTGKAYQPKDEPNIKTDKFNFCDVDSFFHSTFPSTPTAHSHCAFSDLLTENGMTNQSKKEKNTNGHLNGEQTQNKHTRMNGIEGNEG